MFILFTFHIINLQVSVAEVKKQTNKTKTYKVLSDVVKVFPIFLQSLLKHGCFRGAPLLHLIPAEHWAARRNQHAQSAGQIVIMAMQRVHRMELQESRHHRPSLKQYSGRNSAKKYKQITP